MSHSFKSSANSLYFLRNFKLMVNNPSEELKKQLFCYIKNGGETVRAMATHFEVTHNFIYSLVQELLKSEHIAVGLNMKKPNGRKITTYFNLKEDF